MTKKYGILFILVINLLGLVSMSSIGIWSYGIIVLGSYSLKDSNELLFEIIYINLFLCLVLFIFNYLILKYFFSEKKKLFLSIVVSLLTFIISLPIIYNERSKFLKNGRQNTFEIDYSRIKTRL